MLVAARVLKKTRFTPKITVRLSSAKNGLYQYKASIDWLLLRVRKNSSNRKVLRWNPGGMRNHLGQFCGLWVSATQLMTQLWKFWWWSLDQSQLSDELEIPIKVLIVIHRKLNSICTRLLGNLNIFCQSATPGDPRMIQAYFSAISQLWKFRWWSLDQSELSDESEISIKVLIVIHRKLNSGCTRLVGNLNIFCQSATPGDPRMSRAYFSAISCNYTVDSR